MQQEQRATTTTTTRRKSLAVLVGVVKWRQECYMNRNSWIKSSIKQPKQRISRGKKVLEEESKDAV